MHKDLVVSGGGIVGLCAALAAAQQGYSVSVVDSGDFCYPEEEQFTRVYAINAASRHLLQNLGVWSALEMPWCTPYRQMEVSDSLSAQGITFDCRSIASSELGHIISERTLKKALLTVIAQYPLIELHSKTSIQQLHSTPKGMDLDCTEQALSCQLLVVAEGPRSSTRRQLALPLHEWSYHQHAVVTRLHCEKPHQNIARQIFLPSGPLAFLPLANPHECSIVWSTRPGHAKYLQLCDAVEFNQLCAQAFEHRLGAVQILNDRHSFPLHMCHVKQYTGNHWLIMGDAAHSIHPLAGLGLNLGLADVSLCNTLLFKPHRLTHHRAMGTYQRRRKSEVWQTILLMQGLKSLFASPVSPLQGIRGLGLSFINQVKPIKNALMREAMGLKNTV